MAGRPAALWLLLGLAVLIGATAPVSAADGASSDIKLQDVTVSLLEASGSPSSTHKVAGTGAGLKLVLDHTRTLKVSLRAKLGEADEDFRAQQAFVRLTHQASGAAAFFAAVRAKDGTLYATAKPAEIQKQIGLQSGAYDLALLVGDTRTPQPLQWDLGEVDVLHPPLDDGSQPPSVAYRSMDAVFKPKPEIIHMHRQPERRAHAVVSLAFSGVVLVPLAAFVVLALREGANIKGFPTDGAGFLAAVGFHAGLASIVGLYLLFWLQLNLMQTVPILVVLGAVTSAFGAKNLANVDAAAAAGDGGKRKPQKQE